jgi:hypothetical protein
MRYLYGLAAAVLLGGCGGGREDQAIEACATELGTKLTGKSYSLDKADMRAKAKAEDDNVVNITSQVTFDAGLPGEYKQAFECKARVDGAQAAVIALTFSW